MFPRTNTLFDILDFFASTFAFENSLEFFGIVIFFTKETHVKALSKNEMLPAVKIPLFGAVRRMISSEALASILSGFEVMAVDLFAIFATLMFVIVFPDIETK